MLRTAPAPWQTTESGSLCRRPSDTCDKAVDEIACMAGLSIGVPRLPVIPAAFMTPVGRCLCSRRTRIPSSGASPTTDPYTVFSDLLLGGSFFMPPDAYVSGTVFCFSELSPESNRLEIGRGESFVNPRVIHTSKMGSDQPHRKLVGRIMAPDTVSEPMIKP